MKSSRLHIEEDTLADIRAHLAPLEVKRVRAAMSAWDDAQHHAARVWASAPSAPEPAFLSFARGA